MCLEFNPIKPEYHGEVTNDYLNEADDWGEELWCLEHFTELENEREKNDAST